MTYSNRFRFYSSIVGGIAFIALLLIAKAAVNAAFDPIYGAVPFSQLDNPPKDALVLIQNYGDKDGGVSQIVGLDGTVVQKTSAAIERDWYSVARFWNNEQFIVLSSNREGTPDSKWFTSKNGMLQEIQLPDACEIVPPEKKFTDVQCRGVISLSPDAQQVLFAGWYVNSYAAGGQSEALSVLWNRTDNTSRVIQKADLPIDAAIQNDDSAYLSIEWEKNSPHTAFVIVQKENEDHQLVQLARFRYSFDNKVFEPYSLTADYGPLMVPVVQENARLLDATEASSHPVALPYTYEKFGGVLNPFHSIVVRNSTTQVGSTIMRWKKLLGFNSVYVYQVDSSEDPQWFIVRIDNNLFLTKIGSTEYSYITSLPYESPDDMPTIMVDVFAAKTE